MRVRHYNREIPGLHGVLKRYRGQPGESVGHTRARAPEDGESSAKFERQSRGPKQIRLQSDG